MERPRCAPPSAGLDARNQRAQSAQRVGFDAVTDAGAVDLSADQSGVLEHLEMLRHRGLRKPQIVDEIATDAGIATGQQAQDLDARRMPDGLGQGSQFGIGIVPFNGASIKLTRRWRATGGC